MFPKARQDDLIVKEFADETLVYDLRRDKAHSLNRIASLIWRHCDGKTSLADLASVAQRELGVPVNETAVQVALEKLSKRRLLETPVDGPSEAERLTRRKVLKALAAAMAMPVVMSLTAPKAMASVSPTHTTTTARATTTSATTTSGTTTSGTTTSGTTTSGTTTSGTTTSGTTTSGTTTSGTTTSGTTTSGTTPRPTTTTTTPPPS